MDWEYIKIVNNYLFNLLFLLLISRKVIKDLLTKGKHPQPHRLTFPIFIMDSFNIN